jgi:hypothetical protein
MTRIGYLAPALALVMGGCGTAEPADGTRPSLAITLRVVNWANLPSTTLARAERDTDYILGKAGIEIRWVDCNSTVVGLETRNPCFPQKLSPNEFWLRILLSKQPGDSEEMLGHAVSHL